jgi:hypothetical protein
MTEACATLAGLPAIGSYRFHFRARTDVAMPAYDGSAWRGVLGHGLRRIACVTRAPTCDGCMLRTSCVYATVFEAPLPATRAAAPERGLAPPFVLVPNLTAKNVAAGGHVTLGLTLFADANRAVPFMVHALRLAGDRGIGPGRGAFDFVDVEQDITLDGTFHSVFDADAGELALRRPALPSPPPAPQAVSVDLSTPLRVKHHNHFVGARDFTALVFLQALLRRLDGLGRWHADACPSHIDRGYAQARTVTLADADLRWREWTRRSARQRQSMQMGGLVGRFTLALHGTDALWPYLWYGQWAHVGKTPTMGLGGYRLDPPQGCEPLHGDPADAESVPAPGPRPDLDSTGRPS